jgi:hypothetical protein
MFCPSCGKELKDGSKFCKYCGYKITSNSNANAVPTNNDTTANTKERNEKVLIGVLIAAIAILAIVFVAFGTGLFNGNGGDNSQDVSSSSSSQPVSLSSFPVSEAPALAQAIKNSGGNFPIKFKSLSLSKAQCLYILTKSISLISDGSPDSTISVGDPSYAPHPSGRDYSQSIPRSNYVDMCKRFSSWIENDGAVPNYIGITTPGAADISPSRMLDICVSILIDYGNTKSLPSSVKI